MNFFSRDKKSAFEAKEAAQWIAFGPVIFQVARVLRNSGILKLIEESGTVGLTNEEIAEKTSLSVRTVYNKLHEALKKLRSNKAIRKIYKAVSLLALLPIIILL